MIWLHRYVKLVAALHRPADRGRRHGDEHRLGPLGARLADDLRLVHVLVPDEQVGRRDPLRAQPPADREHGRLPHDHPGGLDLAGRAARAGCAARLRGARRGHPAGPARRPDRAASSCRRAVSIGHAGLAQLFFCLTLTLALVTSPGWKNAVAPVDDPMLRRVAPRHDGADLHADSPRRDDAAHRRGAGDPGLPARVRPRGAAGVEREDRDSLRAPRRRAGRHARDPRHGRATSSTTIAGGRELVAAGDAARCCSSRCRSRSARSSSGAACSRSSTPRTSSTARWCWARRWC